MRPSRMVVEVARLSPSDRRRVAEAAFELIRASLDLHSLAGRSAVERLGVVNHEAEGHADECELQEAKRIGRVVSAVARRLPWQPSCLRQALAVQRMLRRRGIASRLHLGVASPSAPAAHAWVTVGGDPVVGEDGLERFVPLATFE